jgi:hypothetical protein
MLIAQPQGKSTARAQQHALQSVNALTTAAFRRSMYQTHTKL